MAYQNVGTPRFYVDKLSYVKALGAGVGGEAFDFNPSNQVTRAAGNMQGFQFSIPNGFPLGKLNFYALLGHNFANKRGQIEHRDAVNDATYWSVTNHFTYDTVVNTHTSGGRPTHAHNGFSIGGLNVDADDYPSTKSIMWYYAEPSDIATPATLGAFLIGEYYDMPHSPDLNLKLSYEYDGVKNIQTKGGSTFSNASYTKPADWGDGGAWQLSRTLLYGDSPGYSQSPVPSNLRSGRRVWDLSFSYLSDTDVFPVNASNSYDVTIGSETGYASGDLNASQSAFTSNILNGTDFFSSVWNKTMGGHLPFVFQPDGNNSNPDQFCIARFDMKSLQYEQVANNVYNVKLKIRESW